MRHVTKSTWDYVANSPGEPIVEGFSLNPFEYLAKGAQGAISAIADQGSGDLRKAKREADRQYARAQKELGALKTDVARMKGQREGEQRAAEAARFARPEPVAPDKSPAFYIAGGAVAAAALVGLLLAVRR